MFRRWSKKEIEIIQSDIPMAEMAKKTGRTIRAIMDKQVEIKRGYCTEPLEEAEEYINNPYKNLTREQKIGRIHDLADNYTVIEAYPTFVRAMRITDNGTELYKCFNIGDLVTMGALKTKATPNKSGYRFTGKYEGRI